MNRIQRLAWALMTPLALAACSMLEPDRIDYKSATKAPTLAVPPDLTQLSRDNRYAVPGGAVSASAYQTGQRASGVSVAPASVGDVSIRRDGTQRWLVVKRSPEALWDPVRDFWQENGFLLSMDQKELGIMETDWAENRAKIPQDFIRESIGKVFDALYSSGERDRFRTRLERSATGETEIYVSHRGMTEVYTSANRAASGDGSTAWQPRPVDPGLEAEFLRRMMVKLGVSAEQSKALVAAGAVTPAARTSTVNGQPVVMIDEAFDRAWRRVGLSLDRTGFTVEDRDRAQGTYYVRYVEPTMDKAEQGFFARLFSSSPKAKAPLKYRVVVRGNEQATVVSVQNESGGPDNSASAQRIVKVLVDDLK